MIKYVIGILVILNLTACGRTHYEYFVGEKGDTGPQGEAGADATPVTVVKLCPGATTYPSTFIEVAFCVQGSLYATYSANGGFTTELVPGHYSSHAINSSCGFTVQANCVVVVD